MSLALRLCKLVSYMTLQQIHGPSPEVCPWPAGGFPWLSLVTVRVRIFLAVQTKLYLPSSALQGKRNLFSKVLGCAVIVSGGRIPGLSVNTTEIYSLATGIWTLTSPLITPRYFHLSLPLSPLGQPGGAIPSLSSHCPAAYSEPISWLKHLLNAALTSGGFDQPPPMTLAVSETYPTSAGAWQANGNLTVDRTSHEMAYTFF